MIIKPKIRGFVCVTAHPKGCEQNVREQIDYVEKHKKINNGPKKVLVIGSSTGYGLSTRIAAAIGCGADTFGCFFERPSMKGKPASAGWYNTAAFEKLAQERGLQAYSMNGDAFSNEFKDKAIEEIKNTLGQIDLVVYSLASPRRTDPVSGEVYKSTLKPIGANFKSKSLDTDKEKIVEVELEAASQEEIEHTEKVMGGEDWSMWIKKLAGAGLLSSGAKTIAYSYLGPELTWPIYKDGTIGKAKEHLAKTALELNKFLEEKLNGGAMISVNKAVVTQASSAIPVVPLYISILFKIMKEQGSHENCIHQMHRMLEGIFNGGELAVDKDGLLRLDDLELADGVQNAVQEVWSKLSDENLKEKSDFNGYRDDFLRLFGFNMSGVDYDEDVEVEVPIPGLIS